DGQVTHYLIDTVQAYPQVLLEYSPGGVIIASYVYGNGLISQNRGGAQSIFLVDGLGSTRALTSSSGTLTDTYAYDAFGRTLGQSGSTLNPYLFAGQQRDFATGLDYLRARYLDPNSGRFVSHDAFPATLNNPMTLNRYIYAAADPVLNVDP